MIYVGIDDTDTLDAPGTNQLARSLIQHVAAHYQSVMAVRHQLLVDPRIPYTRKNSSASILFEPRDAVPSVGDGTSPTRPSGGHRHVLPNGRAVEDLADRLRRAMRDRFVEGSDPGLCIAEQVPPEVIEFGGQCQRELVDQQQARRLAAACNIHLEGLGGTEDGVIGALAAVGLVAGGNDGRVVNIADWPDDLAGPQAVSTLFARGVDEIRCAESGELVRSGTVDVGKHLRPNYRHGRIVQFVTKMPRHWQAVRLT